jgi:hypothetical protein
MSVKKSQATEIRTYLERNDHITQFMAMAVFKIMRLASRIDEIRNDLFDEGDNVRVHTEMTKDARGSRYARYRLVKSSNPLFYDLEGCHVIAMAKEAA